MTGKHGANGERLLDPCVRVPPLFSDIAMTNQTDDARTNVIDTERLLAEYRETIIKLEAHGSPEERGALWDVLGAMLADMKRQQTRQQTSIQTPETPSR
jgi:hypothetical protein